MEETTLSGQVMTFEEYLEFEKESPVKHEFVGGRLYVHCPSANLTLTEIFSGV